LLDTPKSKTPTINPGKSSVTEYTITYEPKNGFSSSPIDGSKITIVKPEIKGYHPSLNSKTDLYHNFPISFDKTIIQSGSVAQRISDGAFMYTIPGNVNGVQGIYTIGINSSGIVFHRTFYDWASYLKIF